MCTFMAMGMKIIWISNCLDDYLIWAFFKPCISHIIRRPGLFMSHVSKSSVKVRYIRRAQMCTINTEHMYSRCKLKPLFGLISNLVRFGIDMRGAWYPNIKGSWSICFISLETKRDFKIGAVIPWFPNICWMPCLQLHNTSKETIFCEIRGIHYWDHLCYACDYTPNWTQVWGHCR